MKTADTFGISFFVRRNRENNGTVPVFLRITVNGKRSEISTKQKVQNSNWDKKRGFGKGQSPEVKKINTYLERLRGKVVESYQELKLSKKTFTVDDVRNLFLGVEESKHTLLSIYDYHNEIEKNKLAKGTMTNFYSTQRHVKRFLKEKLHVSDIFLSQLNYKFLTDFELFLQQKNNGTGINPICKNTITKNIVRLRKVVNLAIKNEWIDKDPFSKFTISYVPSTREYLPAEELAVIEKHEFTTPGQKLAKDLFIFSCYTGLAYIDTFNLTPQHVSIGIDGEYWIVTSRKKTDHPVRIPILPKALEIIEKYKTDAAVLAKGKLLPSIANPKLNLYLKEIAEICGTTKHLTFHVARHTFATTITLTNGVPIETVSKMLGHSNIRTTQIYAKVIESKVSDDMKSLREKLDFQNIQKQKLSKVVM
jgi:site-specific recombinase XerD